MAKRRINFLIKMLNFLMIVSLIFLIFTIYKTNYFNSFISIVMFCTAFYLKNSYTKIVKMLIEAENEKSDKKTI